MSIPINNPNPPNGPHNTHDTENLITESMSAIIEINNKIRELHEHVEELLQDRDAIMTELEKATGYRITWGAIE